MKKTTLIFISFILITMAGFFSPKCSLATEIDKQDYISLGLMSGTSMDGIDAGFLRTNGCSKIEDLGHDSMTYNIHFHRLLKAASYIVRTKEGDIEEAHKADFHQAFRDCLREVFKITDEAEASNMLCQAANYLHKNPSASITLEQVIDHSAQLHIEMVYNLLKKYNYQPNQIDVIGYHGQTLYHNPPKKITIQAGNAQKLADETGIPVIHRFRNRDVASGGQGAPFAPLYHQALAERDGRFPLAVVNCGGIANISLIGGPKFEDLLGYDTGAGNALIDRFVKQRTQFKESMDLDGKYGLQGKVYQDILEKLLHNSIIKDGMSYVNICPPKSLDENDLKLIPELDSLSLEDGCATLATLTGEFIIRSLSLIPHFPVPKHWILAGGGWHNVVIRRELDIRVRSQFGADAQVNLAEEIGWNNKAMESQIFAWLAVRSLQGEPLSVPQTTKVLRPLTGGQVYLPKQGGFITEKIQGLLKKNPDVLNGYQE